MWATKILKDISQYENYSLKNDVSDRLNKVMIAYVNELDNTCARLLSKKRQDLVMKELAKNGN